RFERETSAQLDEQLASRAAGGRENLAWAIYQLSGELGRLTEAARERVAGLPSAGSDLRLRFDIFISRIDTIQLGTIRRDLQDQAFYRSAIRA
ncbi:hypothetical protein ACE4Z5_25420, partial [Salmonella enterica]|uniref:hypothetical protein n=1 Tax=Salmonella enterica TaxID=28901 RepID=UPI003D275AE7